MVYLTLNPDKFRENYHYLNTVFKSHGIAWSVVTKMLCGNCEYLHVLADLGVKQCCDSRIANLKLIKTEFPWIETIFIKPPAGHNVEGVVRYADISFNTSLRTVVSLSEAAEQLGKIHKVILVIELGELREGILGADLESMYEATSALPNIEIVGLGANMTCMYGILPSYDNLQQLVQLRNNLEQKYGVTLPVVSGGASVSIPLLFSDELPAAVNHFRVGETLFLGTDVYNNTHLEQMNQDVFTLFAEIIELKEKPNVPYGELGYNLTGQKNEVKPVSLFSESYRAIVDIGLLDTNVKFISPLDTSIKIAGASSDMTVVDLGKNKYGYRVGDKIPFSMTYMGLLGIMNSKYIDKRVQHTPGHKNHLLPAGEGSLQA